MTFLPSLLFALASLVSPSPAGHAFRQPQVAVEGANVYLAFGAPNELISAFPLAMIPVFLVPLSILLHLASLKKLQQTRTAGQQLPDALLSSRRS